MPCSSPLSSGEPERERSSSTSEAAMVIYVDHSRGPNAGHGVPEHRPDSVTAVSGSIVSLRNAVKCCQMYACSKIVGRSVCAVLRSCPINCKSCLSRRRDVGTGVELRAEPEAVTRIAVEDSGVTTVAASLRMVIRLEGRWVTASIAAVRQRLVGQCR